MKTQANSTLRPLASAPRLARIVADRFPSGFGPRRTHLGALALAVALAVVGISASAQEAASPSVRAATAAVTTNTPAAAAPVAAQPAPALQQTRAETATNALASARGQDAGTNGLRLNFRNAPIDLVLKYLSDAAGFIIELDTPVHGTVSVISSHPMTRDEAVDLLNSVLNRNGYAAIRNGRTLKIMDKATAKSSNNPVMVGDDPAAIPNNDEMVTQIIPIRFVDATQLASDLSPFVSPQATIIANQAGNSIVITDTQANIRHLAEIIKAIDTSAEDVTELRVFHLQHADPTEMANLLSSLFPDQGSSGAQLPVRFGRGGFFGRFAAAMATRRGSTGNSQNDRIKKRMQVIAVADPRTSSVVVTASKDLMSQIADMIKDLDFKSDKDQTVKVFHLNNADPQEILPVLQDMFQNNTTQGRNTRTGSTQNSPFQTRLQQYQNNNNAASTSFGNTGLGSRNSRGGGGF